MTWVFDSTTGGFTTPQPPNTSASGNTSGYVATSVASGNGGMTPAPNTPPPFRVWTTKDRATRQPAGFVYTARCTCGWTAEHGDVRQACLGADKHLLEHQVGVVEVQCFMCGDRLPASATRLIRSANGEDVEYMCERCVTEPPLDMSRLVDDLVDLERELRD